MKRHILNLFFILIFVSGKLSAQSFKFTAEPLNSATLLGENYLTHIKTLSAPPSPGLLPWPSNPVQSGPCIWGGIVGNTIGDMLDVGVSVPPSNDLAYKDLKSTIKLRVNYDELVNKKYKPYVYLVTLKIRGFTSFDNCQQYSEFNDTLMISYMPDRGYVSQDVAMKTYYGFYSLQIQVQDVYNLTDMYYPNGVPLGSNFYATLGTCNSNQGVSGGITTLANGWRDMYNVNPTACPDPSTNWILTAEIHAQEFIKNIPGGVPQANVYNNLENVVLVPKHIAPSANDNKLSVRWIMSLNQEPKPAMYEFEWTYVDNYKVEYTGVANNIMTISEKPDNQLKYNFKENATRIVTDKMHYDIPLIYKKGYVVYRVRLIRPNLGIYDKSLYSEWSLPEEGLISSISSSGGGNYPYFKILTPHVADQMNWNFQTSYAEDGKSKNVVSYFDGLLKNRQSVTKFGSLDNQLIVAEPVYNYEGAVGLQSLPIPVIKNDVSDNKSLTYQQNFLINSSTTNHFKADDIDNLAAPVIPPLATTSLASNYYSATNKFLGASTPGSQDHAMYKAIPNADGFPFIQTRFAIDNPKLVKVQGGAGAALQIGEGHETQFSYLDPTQAELNQYLGLNIGLSKFYEKTITRDPNGQLSFSIANNAGKPVMTGLMQKPESKPADFPLVNIDKVNFANASTLTTDLLYGLTRVWNGTSLNFNKTYFNEGGNNVFNYQIGLLPFTYCNSSISWNIPLDIQIEARGESPSPTLTIANTQTAVGNAAVSETGTLQSSALAVGEVVTDLSVSYKQEDLEAKVDDFLAPYIDPESITQPLPPCIDHFNDFLNKAMENLPEEPCVWNPDQSYIECAEYKNLMIRQLMPNATYAKYAKLGSKMTIVGNDTSLFKIVGWKDKLTNQLLQQSDIIINNPPIYPTPLPNPFEINFTPSIIPLAMSNTQLYTDAISATADTWGEKWGALYDAIEVDYVPVYKYQQWIASINPVPVPNSPYWTDIAMNVADFLEKYTEGIALRYLPLHPENCYLDQIYCDQAEGIEFTTALEAINDFQTAKELGLAGLNELLDNDPVKPWSANLPGPIAYNDFIIKGKDNNGASLDMRIDYYACLQTYLQNFPLPLFDQNATIYSNFFTNNIWGANTALGTSSFINIEWSNLFSTFTDAQMDNYYKLLKSLYLGKRREIPTAKLALTPNACGSDVLPLVPSKSVLRYIFSNDAPSYTDNDPNNTDALAEYTANNTNAGNGPSATVNFANAEEEFVKKHFITYQSYADYIVKQLRNCMLTASTTLAIDAPASAMSGTAFPALPVGVPSLQAPLNKMESIRNDLVLFMVMNRGTSQEIVWKGGLTPDALKNILSRHGIELDDLCNPYLVQYEESISGVQDQPLCDLRNTWSGLSKSTSNLHTSFFNIFDKVLNQNSTYTTGNVSSTLNLNATGNPTANPVNPFDDLIHYSLGLGGSETYQVSVTSSYSNTSTAISNLATPLTNAINYNVGAGTNVNVSPNGITYTITANGKNVTMQFQPSHTFSLNGMYRCFNTIISLPGVIPQIYGCDPVNLPPGSTPLTGNQCSNSNYTGSHPANPELGAFIETNSYLRKQAFNGNLFAPASNSTGEYYVIDCNTLAEDPNAIVLKVLYYSKVEQIPNTQPTDCGNLAYLYAFDLKITGLNLGKLNNECITAYEFKREYPNLKAEVATAYQIKGPQHPFYEKTLQNFYNYTFRKTHPAEKYLGLMQGAHLAKFETIPDYYDYFQAHGTTAQIQSIINWFNTYTITQGGSTLYPAKDINYFRYKEGSTEHLYVDLTELDEDERLRRFLIALNTLMGTTGIPITEYASNKLESEFNPLNLQPKVEIFTNTPLNPLLSIPYATIVNSVPVVFKQGVSSHSFFRTKFEFPINPDPKLISDAIYAIQQIADGTFAYVYFGSHLSTSDQDNTNPNKLAYLTQAYNLGNSVYDYDQIINQVKKPLLLAQVFTPAATGGVFNNPAYLSYSNPIVSQKKIKFNQEYNTSFNNDYISGTLHISAASASSEGQNFLGLVLEAMKSGIAPSPQFTSSYTCNLGAPVTSTGSIFYTGANSYTSNHTLTINNLGNFNGSVTISPRRQEDNIYWFRIKKGASVSNPISPIKYYNIYIKTPDYIPHDKLGAFTFSTNNIIPISTEKGTKAFAIKFTRPANICGSPNSAYFYGIGITDFDLNQNATLSFENLMLCDHDEETPLFEPCFDNLLEEAQSQALVQYSEYISDIRTELITQFGNHIQQNLNTKLTLQSEQMKYALTLYGYDRAGNLIYTIPPNGVQKLAQTDIDHVNTKREDIAANNITNFVANQQVGVKELPEHTKHSTYTYNSLNQLLTQKTPDGGETKFFYDPAGKLAFSQNAVQSIKSEYAYTLYDNQNRIIETGKIAVPSPEVNPNHTLNLLIANLKNYNYFQNVNYNEWIRDHVRMYFRTEVVCTYYDAPLYTFATTTNGMSEQQNLRGRVATIASYPSLGANASAGSLQNNFVIAQHYSYDFSGNVEILTYDMPELAYLKQRYKRIDYDYDLYSGKVNLVSYNRGGTDQYYQRYAYDDDNRITNVETSADGLLWDKDAKYTYYPHGPLARVELSDLRVQGIDFAYTLQGWLKYINGDQANPTHDIGGDAQGASTMLADKLKHGLYYYEDDYKPINETDASHTANTQMHTVKNIPQVRSLYNGNISSSLTAPGIFEGLYTEYWYDQLNRIKKARYKLPDYSTNGTTPYVYDNAVKPLSNALNASAMNLPFQSSLAGLDISKAYSTDYTYDLDGNIETLNRYGVYYPSGSKNLKTGTPQVYQMDAINYVYDNTTQNNKLKDYTETAAHMNTTTGTDFDNDLQLHNPGSPVDRFKYDAIGNLVKDLSNPNPNSISDIYWTLYGKVAKIDYSGQNSYTLFGYEPGGNRFKKTTIKPLSAQSATQVHLNEYYIREASGNILAIYRQRKELDMVKPFEDLLQEIKLQPGFSGAMANILKDNDEFVGHLSEELLNEQPAFLADLTDGKSASYYLKNSSSTKLAMVQQTPQMLMDLYNSTPDSLYAVLPQSASDVFGIMLHEQNDSIKKLYIAHLADENDPELFQYYSDYFAVENEMIDMESFKEGMFRELADLDIIDAHMALSNFWSQQTPERWHGLLNRLLSDADYMNTDNLLFNYTTMHSFVLNRLGQYGDTTLLGDYFDAMNPTTATAILHSVTGKAERAQIVYATEPEAMFEAMKVQAWFAPLMEKAMKASTSISFTNFAFDLSSNIDIGLSVSAFLVPKIREDHYYLAEHHMYGSSRLGIKNYWSNHYAFHYDYNATNNTMTWAQALEANQLLSFKRPWYSQKLEGLIQANETVPYGHLNTNQVLSTRQLGLKQYELTNHLGNVMAVVTDKLVDSVANANATTDPLPTASIRNAWASASYDYYPFGMLMPERYTEDKTVQCTPVSTPVYYPYWINLMQVAMDDPIQVNYFATTNTMDVMEVNADNQKLYLKASPTGEEQAVSMDISSGIVANMLMNVSFTLSNQSEHFTSIQIQQQNANLEWETLASTTVAREADVNLDFTPTNTSMLKLIIKGHDMDVIVGAIKYKRLDLFGTSVVSTICNSSEFDEDYRFGFNGQMKTNEIKGIGNHNTALFWEYDTRLGRRWNLDPVDQISISNYATFGNNPIFNVLGNTYRVHHNKMEKNKEGNWIEAKDKNGKAIPTYTDINSDDDLKTAVERSGNNPFVRDFVMATQKEMESGADLGINHELINHNEAINVIETNSGSGYIPRKNSLYNPKQLDLSWNRNDGYVHKNSKDGKLLFAPPSLLLLHEKGHAFFDLFGADDVKLSILGDPNSIKVQLAKDPEQIVVNFFERNLNSSYMGGGLNARKFYRGSVKVPFNTNDIYSKKPADGGIEGAKLLRKYHNQK